MQICFGSTWALLSSKWLKANENWPEHGYIVLERNPDGWDGYLRQLCLIFNFTGGILSRAECKPLRNIIFLYLMQRCDILAARWEHLLCQSKGQNECQPGRLRQARPEGGSHDDAPQSPSQLCQISSDLQLGWHPGPRGRRAAPTLPKHLSKTIAMGRGEDADTRVSVRLQ